MIELTEANPDSGLWLKLKISIEASALARVAAWLDDVAAMQPVARVVMNKDKFLVSPNVSLITSFFCFNIFPVKIYRLVSIPATGDIKSFFFQDSHNKRPALLLTNKNQASLILFN